jgi:hypothetical protein
MEVFMTQQVDEVQRGLILSGRMTDQVHAWAEYVLGPGNLGIGGSGQPIGIAAYERVQSGAVETAATQNHTIGTAAYNNALQQEVTRMTALREAGSTLFGRFQDLQVQGGLQLNDAGFQVVQERWIEYVNQHPELRNPSTLTIAQVQALTAGIEGQIQGLQKANGARNNGRGARTDDGRGTRTLNEGVREVRQDTGWSPTESADLSTALSDLSIPTRTGRGRGGPTGGIA